MVANKKQRKIMVPIKELYASVAHPTIPSMSPTANTNQVIALLALFDIESPPYIANP